MKIKIEQTVEITGHDLDVLRASIIYIMSK